MYSWVASSRLRKKDTRWQTILQLHTIKIPNMIGWGTSVPNNSPKNEPVDKSPQDGGGVRSGCDSMDDLDTDEYQIEKKLDDRVTGLCQRSLLVYEKCSLPRPQVGCAGVRIQPGSFSSQGTSQEKMLFTNERP